MKIKANFKHFANFIIFLLFAHQISCDFKYYIKQFKNTEDLAKTAKKTYDLKKKFDE